MGSPASGSSAALSRLGALGPLGQSLWLDFIRRSLLQGGELRRLVEEDGIRGVTSNPAIFEKAIDGSDDYRAAIDELNREAPGLPAKEVYERLAVKDIQDAADVLMPVYDETKARDGYVSLEVSPDLAHDTGGTLGEARRLWAAVGRPNVMIKVPATPEGLPAIEALIAEGINVNVTLLFAQEAYEQVAHAYIAGLYTRAAQGGDLRHVASVASFFVSRIDTAVDALLDERLKTASGAGEQALLRSLLGSGHRQCQADVSALSGAVPWRALAGSGR
jgi:transaldolase/glucose-6-phosphate isomerase